MIDYEKINNAKKIVKILSERVSYLDLSYRLAMQNMTLVEPAEDEIVKIDLEDIERLIVELNKNLK